MSDESYAEKVAARRAALPSAPVLDFVDYIKAVCGIEQHTLDILRQQGIFLAAICGYALDRFPEAGGAKTLAYGAWYYLKHRHETLPVLDEYQATDCLRIACYCLNLPSSGLPASDPRSIHGDYDRWTSEFPQLCPRILNNSPEKARFQNRALMAIGGFAVEHPLRTESMAFMSFPDKADYAEYWVERSEEKVGPYFEDERFVAGLDAMAKGNLSYWGMMHNVYGDDFESRGQLPFDPLQPWLAQSVVSVLSFQVRSGRRAIPSGLQEKYSDFYQPYSPEAFGLREKSNTGDS